MLVGTGKPLQISLIVTNSLHRDSFKISTNANKRVIINKLVTIFAPHTEIVTPGQLASSLRSKFVPPALDNSISSGIILSFAGTAKIAPWCLARRDSFSAKAPGLVTASLRHQRLLIIPAAVSVHLQGITRQIHTP
jgi:hypothetical protein